MPLRRDRPLPASTAVEGAPGRARVLLVCSTGGHLAQLHRLEPWWRCHDRAWVTFDKSDARSLLADERTYWAHHPTTRNVGNLVRNSFLALRILRAERPRLIVSNGAGVAVPFFFLGRLLGARTAYVEVVDRVASPTLTGRMVRRATTLFCVQWPEQQEFYRGATVVGPLV
ncbi:MAG: UDP-N-acetylglucosamine--LPS N-acetylglucosamine transferase [Actinobacteria bacterium]|nr:UDP-N-acetylglucosamine--LPS N-acetylglucosamine transferase [Actinomycetota bacterium]